MQYEWMYNGDLWSKELINMHGISMNTHHSLDWYNMIIIQNQSIFLMFEEQNNSLVPFAAW